METVGELLRDAGIDADAFDVQLASVSVPANLAYALRLEQPDPLPAAALAVPEGSLVVLAGPEVVRNRCIDGLRAFASAANAPVANTWGAKGALEWDSPHHMGTCGLQERDFELLGFADYDVIVATGTDPFESPPARFALAPLVVDVDPLALAALADQVAPAPGPIPGNDLYARLAAVAQPGFVDDRVPLHPARAVADVRAALPSGGVVFADPGPAGLWVARTFPTTAPGTVVVPAMATPGIATTLALIAALRGHEAIAVTTEPLDQPTLAALEIAADLAATFVVDVWGAAGPVQHASDHVQRLHAAVSQPGVTLVDAPVDLSLTDALIEAAGPVVAWGGLVAT